MKIKYLALSFAFVAAGLSSANADRLVIKGSARDQEHNEAVVLKQLLTLRAKDCAS
jgi:uncharacterized protein YeaO (DUF488 family)